MRTLFLTHEQRLLYFEEPGYTEVIQPLSETGLFDEISIHNYQREWRWIKSQVESHSSNASSVRDACSALQTRLLGQHITDFRPELVVYIPTWPAEAVRSNVLRNLKSRHNFRLCSLIWDHQEADLDSQTHDRCTIAVSDLTIVVDSKTRVDRIRARKGSYKDFENVESVFFMPTVPSATLFRPSTTKSIEVLISGSLEGYRAQVPRSLLTAGLPVTHSGGIMDASTALPFSEYARQLAESKIVVNTQTSPNRVQLKGRVAQTLSCGSFLLEQDNPESRHYLDGIPVEFWSSETELIEKVRYYLAHDDERETRALSCHTAWRQRYTAKALARKLIGRPTPG